MNTATNTWVSRQATEVSMPGATAWRLNPWFAGNTWPVIQWYVGRRGILNEKACNTLPGKPKIELRSNFEN